MNLEPMKTAVIGCGDISDIYLYNLKNLFRITELVACSNRTPEKAVAKAEKYGIEARTNEEIYSDPEIGLIVNLTQPKVHYEIIRKALEAGKHVYTEKTMTSTFEQAEELCALAKEKGLRLGTAPDTFLGGTIQTAGELIEKGMIGKPLSVSFSLSRNQAANSDKLPHLRQVGGSLSYDVGVYYLMAAASLFGPAESVAAFESVYEPEWLVNRLTSADFGKVVRAEVNNVFTAAVRYRSGILATVHINGKSIINETRFFRIYGTEGVLDIEDPNSFGSKLILEKPGTGKIVFPSTHGFIGNSRGVGAAEMAWSIRENRPHRASAEMGLNVMEILKGIDVSAETGEFYHLKTTFDKPELLPAGYRCPEEMGNWGPTEESALI